MWKLVKFLLENDGKVKRIFISTFSIASKFTETEILENWKRQFVWCPDFIKEMYRQSLCKIEGLKRTKL